MAIATIPPTRTSSAHPPNAIVRPFEPAVRTWLGRPWASEGRETRGGGLFHEGPEPPPSSEPSGIVGPGRDILPLCYAARASSIFSAWPAQ